MLKLLHQMYTKLNGTRKQVYYFDSDSVAECVASHFKSDGYKVSVRGGEVTVSKRWWKR